MAKFDNFKSWKNQRNVEITEESNTDSEKKETKDPEVPGNSELLALIEDLAEKRNAASRANDGLGRQIYDLDIRVAKLEMQKNELLAKKKDLEGARSISEVKKRIPRNNHE